MTDIVTKGPWGQGALGSLGQGVVGPRGRVAKGPWGHWAVGPLGRGAKGCGAKGKYGHVRQATGIPWPRTLETNKQANLLVSHAVSTHWVLKVSSPFCSVLKRFNQTVVYSNVMAQGVYDNRQFLSDHIIT